MNNRLGIQFCIAGAVLLALSAIAFAAAIKNPQGQYQLSYSPVTVIGTHTTSSLATYSPIKLVNRDEIQLRGEDGVVYTFVLNSDTIFCQGTTRAADWTYLKNVPKKSSVTVLTVDSVNMKAIVIWDTPPTISDDKGQFDFTLPPLC